MSGLHAELQRKIMPVGTYIIATEPLGKDRAQALIRNGACVSDINFVLDYFRLSADHRMLFGGRVSYSTFEPLALTASLKSPSLWTAPTKVQPTPAQPSQDRMEQHVQGQMVHRMDLTPNPVDT